ncbi:MAG: Crp/Fnr family transcriptional regulator [Chitinophagales bacterium]
MKKLLRQHFPVLQESQLQDLIVEHGTLMDVSAGNVIIDFGGYIRHIPLLIKGNIKILREDENGNEVLLYYLGAGETCAMSLTSCMANTQSEIKAVVEEDICMIVIPVRFMSEWLTQFKSWKNFVMDVYRKRFEKLMEVIDSIAFMKMDERLLKYLSDKAEITGKVVFEVTHHEIACDLNSSREVISRLLKKLEKMNKIKLGRNKIKIIDISM